MNIAALRSLFLRAFVFDEMEQSLYLSVISAQLRGGRTYQAIFRDMLLDSSKHVRELARRSLSPTTQYFADGYADYFGRRRAALLVLAQRHNVVEAFIEHVLQPKTTISVFRSIFAALAMEWLTTAVFLALSVAMYLYGDVLRLAFGDISGSFLYRLGRLLVEYRFALTAACAGLLFAYLHFGDRPSPFRAQLKSLGCYAFRDSLFAIEFLATFRVLAGAADEKGGQAASVPNLTGELFRVYGGTPLRARQFRAMQRALAGGKTFRDAIADSGLLERAEFSLYRGLTPDNTMEQHRNAAGAVADQLTRKTVLRLKRLAQTVNFALYLFLAAGMVVMIDVLMGGGISARDLANPQFSQ